MKKKLKLDTVLTNFDGTVIVENEIPLTLKKILLEYIGLAHAMNITGPEEFTLYSIGKKIGKPAGDDFIALELQDFNLLKKIVDSGKITVNGQQQPIFKLVISQQVRVLLEEVENIKD